MARKHHKPEEIVAKLRQVEVLVGQGKLVSEGVRAIGVTEATYYRWRTEYGGLKLNHVKRLEFTRECLAVRVGRKLGSTDVIDVLSDLFIARGTPGFIRIPPRGYRPPAPEVIVLSTPMPPGRPGPSGSLPPSATMLH